MKLFVFPALAPLVSYLPWILTGAAGIAAILSKRKRFFYFLSGPLLMAAMGVYLYQRLPSNVSSEPTPIELLPQIEKVSEIQKNLKAPPLKGRGKTQEAWTALPTRQILSSPTVSKDYVFVGTIDGSLMAYSRHNGELIWTLKKENAILSQPLVVGDSVLVGEGVHTTQKSTLTKIRISDGKVLWQREFRGHLEKRPTADEKLGMVWVSAGPEGLWALDLRTGAPAWYRGVGHVDSTPLLLDGELIVPAQPKEETPETELHGFDPATGKNLWSVKLPGQPWGIPATYYGDVILTTAIGRIEEPQDTDRGWSHRINPKNQQTVWSQKLGGMPLPDSALTPTGKKVFHVLKTGEVLALEAESGKIAWRSKLPSPAYSGVAFLDKMNLLAAQDRGGNLTLFHAHTGEIFASEKVGPESWSTPFFDYPYLFSAAPGMLVALKVVKLAVKE